MISDRFNYIKIIALRIKSIFSCRVMIKIDYSYTQVLIDILEENLHSHGKKLLNLKNLSIRQLNCQYADCCTSFVIVVKINT